MNFSGRKAALHTLGCKVNIYETDAMRAMLEDAGFEIVPFEEAADVYVINTCSVTNIADRKSRQMISRARKRNPGAAVVAAGCYVHTALDRTGKSVDADILLGSSRKGDLLKELQTWFSARDAGSSAASQRSVGNVMQEDGCEQLSVPRIEQHSRAWVKVQDGCNMFCSYCIIPFARGRIRSRSMEEITQELEALARSGIREVILTGIHLSSYGVDFSGNVEDAYGRQGERRTWQERSRLIDLTERVSGIPGIERIRLGSLEPTIITEEFAVRLRETGKVCPHFHLSLQSGCDSVLKRMNRHYTADDYRMRVEILRKVFGHPAVTTDVIVGFPGETEEEFRQTERFLQEIRLYETHVFRYSMRAGTKAAAMPGQVPEAVKEERSDILMKLSEKSRREFEVSWTGCEAEILVEEEARIDDRGYISAPNAGSVRVRAEETAGLLKSGEKLYTGYTREYVRAFVCSGEDLKGRVIKGKLTVESLPILEYT